MKRIKDFFYNISDIFVALLILVVASGIVLWRMGIIVKYPETVLSDDVEFVDELKEDEPESLIGENETEPPLNEDIEGKEEQVVDENSIYSEEGRLTHTIKIDIPSGSAKGAINYLVEQGLFSSYDEYKQICKSLKINPDKVMAGKHTFKSGSTKKDVAKEVNMD